MKKKREKQVEDFVDGLNINKALESSFFNNKKWASTAWPENKNAAVKLTQKMKNVDYRKVTDDDKEVLKKALKDIFKEM